MKCFYLTGLFLFFALFFLPKVSSAESFIYVSNAPRQVEEGNRFTVEVRIDAKTQAVNAVTGTLQFSSDLLRVVSIDKNKSRINFWTDDPKLFRNQIPFEGVILNPGFQGSGANVFSVLFEARKSGEAQLKIIEGALLANDGLGTNILTKLGFSNVKITQTVPLFQTRPIAEINPSVPSKKVVLPVLTEYPYLVNPKESFVLRGKGEPEALTKIVFKEASIKSIGERFVERLQTKKKRLGEVLVKNNGEGVFEYVSPSNLVAGAYNATPFLVDEESSVEKPGLGGQLLISDSKLVRMLVVVINVLGLLIPIVLLCVIIYFIPWYSWLRMRVLRKKINLEEEKLDISEHQLKRQDKILEQKVEKIIKDEN